MTRAFHLLCLQQCRFGKEEYKCTYCWSGCMWLVQEWVWFQVHFRGSWTKHLGLGALSWEYGTEVFIFTAVSTPGMCTTIPVVFYCSTFFGTWLMSESLGGINMWWLCDVYKPYCLSELELAYVYSMSSVKPCKAVAVCDWPAWLTYAYKPLLSVYVSLSTSVPPELLLPCSLLSDALTSDPNLENPNTVSHPKVIACKLHHLVQGDILLCPKLGTQWNVPTFLRFTCKTVLINLPLKVGIC